MAVTQLYENLVREALLNGSVLALRFTVGETPSGQKFFYAAVQGNRINDLLDAFASVVKTDAETRGCNVYVEKELAMGRGNPDTWKIAAPALIINGRKLSADDFAAGHEVTYLTAEAAIGSDERKRCSGLNFKYARTGIQKDAAEAANMRLAQGRWLVTSIKGEWIVDEESVSKQIKLEDQRCVVNLERLSPERYAAYLNAALRDYFAWVGIEARTSAFAVSNDAFAVVFTTSKQGFDLSILPDMPLRLDYHKAVEGFEREARIPQSEVALSAVS